jgi:hypothetical protein
MYKRFKIRRIGNHWYPCVKHDYGGDISLDQKIERYFDQVSRCSGDTDEITIELEEIPIIVEDINLIFFNESDITRFYTTDDDFNLKFEINEHEFEISSYLFGCFELQFDLNFHETLYKLHIW